MNIEERAIKCLLAEAGKVVGTPSYGNEMDIAAEIAIKVCEGKLHTVMIPNCNRERRKRLIAIAFNMVGNKPLICKIFGNKDGKCCETCSRVCCHNKVLQRRFAEEMFPGFKIY